MIMNWLLPLSILVFFEMIADILAKRWSLHGGPILAAGALLAYVSANTFWLFALRNGSGLGRGAMIFSIASAVIAIIIGFVLYHESVSRLQVVGMALGMLALLLIFWE
jgi:drug/metabolite transporter (DMT)-like permease